MRIIAQRACFKFKQTLAYFVTPVDSLTKEKHTQHLNLHFCLRKKIQNGF